MSISEELVEVKKLLQNETHLRKVAEEEVKKFRNQLPQWKRSEVCFYALISVSHCIIFCKWDIIWIRFCFTFYILYWAADRITSGVQGSWKF